MRLRAFGSLLLALALLGPQLAAAAEPSEVDRLRAENARLAERVRALEAERARLLERCPEPLAAAVERAAGEQVSVTVDQDAGATVASTARSRLERTAGGASKHWLTVRARKGPGTAIDSATLVIDADATGGLYRDVHTVQLTIDGRSEELAVASHQSSPITTSGRTGRAVAVAESVTATLPAATLARLAEASTVTGKVGNTSFRLSPEQLVAIRALTQRLR